MLLCSFSFLQLLQLRILFKPSATIRNLQNSCSVLIVTLVGDKSACLPIYTCCSVLTVTLVSDKSACLPIYTFTYHCRKIKVVICSHQDCVWYVSLWLPLVGVEYSCSLCSRTGTNNIPIPSSSVLTTGLYVTFI